MLFVEIQRNITLIPIPNLYYYDKNNFRFLFDTKYLIIAVYTIYQQSPLITCYAQCATVIVSIIIYIYYLFIYQKEKRYIRKRFLNHLLLLNTFITLLEFSPLSTNHSTCLDPVLFLSNFVIQGLPNIFYNIHPSLSKAPQLFSSGFQFSTIFITASVLHTFSNHCIF